MTRHDSCRVTPFGHPGITARLTAPPGLSRPPTSFIGSWYQGIHHLPYTTSTTNQNFKKSRRRKQDARVHYAHLNQQPTTTHTQDTYQHPAGRLPQRWRSSCLTRKTKQRLFFQDLTGCVIPACHRARLSPTQTRNPLPHPTQGQYSRSRISRSSVCQRLRHTSLTIHIRDGRCSLERR